MRAGASVGMMLGAGKLLGPWLLIGGVLLGRRRIAERMSPLAFVACASLLLPIGFSFAKNAIPMLVPYHADPALAAFDSWLHFGHDPWRIAHGLLGKREVGWMPELYMTVWGPCAFGFPLIVLATDPEIGRARHYIWLFFGSWVVIGNGLALAGSSVGPVFYDRLLGTERFVGLTQAIAVSGLSGTSIGVIQEWLWQRYLGGRARSRVRHLGLSVDACRGRGDRCALSCRALALACAAGRALPAVDLLCLGLHGVSLCCRRLCRGSRRARRAFRIASLYRGEKRKKVAHSRCVTIASFRQVS